VNHAAEEVSAHIPTENAAGRGGLGNIGEGPGHYDVGGGHAGAVDATGRGGLGNIGASGAQPVRDFIKDIDAFKAEAHKEHKVTIVDKVIGKSPNHSYI
jgi:hypothetical protein